jgi:hypothetical protein
MTRTLSKTQRGLILLGHGLIWALLIIGLSASNETFEFGGVSGIAVLAGLFAISQSFIMLALKR